MTNEVAKLGREVRARREELGLTQDDVKARGGPSDTTLTKIENGDGPKPAPVTLRKLDASLGWTAGSSARVLDGGTPEVSVPESTDTPAEAAPQPMSVALRKSRRGLAALAVTAGFIDDLRKGIALEPDDGKTPTADEWDTLAELLEELISEVGEFTNRVTRLAADVHGGDDALARAIAERAARFAEVGRRASTVSSKPHQAATFIVYGKDPDLPGDDQGSALTDSNQGERPDFEFAARPGETEDEARERLGIPYD